MSAHVPPESFPPGREAPGDLELVRRFVNTLNLESGADRLESPAHLDDWLEAHGAGLNNPATTAQWRRARALREALRTLAETGPEPAALATANEIAGKLPLVVRFTTSGSTTLESARGGDVDSWLGWLMATVHEAATAGTWQRLKACRNHGCRWLFYDHSKNTAGTWCTMRACGQRLKAKSYRRRQNK